METEIPKFEIKLVAITDLIPSEYNPRKITQKEKAKIKNSIRRFGFVENIVVNSNADRKNIVIGGHQRLQIAKEMGITEVPVHYVDLNLEDEKLLNLTLNKVGGDFDMEKVIAEFEKEMLLKAGFEEGELKKISQKFQDEVDGEKEFSPELMEEHNYVVLYFDNTLDWQVAQEKLGLKAVWDAKGLNKGIGRVIKGKDIVERLK